MYCGLQQQYYGNTPQFDTNDMQIFCNERPHTDKIDLIATAVEFKN